MSWSKEQLTKIGFSGTLVEWARLYFEENKEVMKLLGINSPDALKRRILEIAELNSNFQIKQYNLQLRQPNIVC